MVQDNDSVILQVDGQDERLLDLIRRGVRVRLMQDGRHLATVEPTPAAQQPFEDTEEARRIRREAVEDLMKMGRPTANVSDEQIRQWRDEH